MATEISQLMGEIVEDPDKRKKNVEALIVGFLEALVREQPSKEGAK